jgi:hypothetical protein
MKTIRYFLAAFALLLASITSSAQNYIPLLFYGFVDSQSCHAAGLRKGNFQNVGVIVDTSPIVNYGRGVPKLISMIGIDTNITPPRFALMGLLNTYGYITHDTPIEIRTEIKGKLFTLEYISLQSAEKDSGYDGRIQLKDNQGNVCTLKIAQFN